MNERPVVQKNYAHCGSKRMMKPEVNSAPH